MSDTPPPPSGFTPPKSPAGPPPAPASGAPSPSASAPTSAGAGAPGHVPGFTPPGAVPAFPPAVPQRPDAPSPTAPATPNPAPAQQPSSPQPPPAYSPPAPSWPPPAASPQPPTAPGAVERASAQHSPEAARAAAGVNAVRQAASSGAPLGQRMEDVGGAAGEALAKEALHRGADALAPGSSRVVGKVPGLERAAGALGKSAGKVTAKGVALAVKANALLIVCILVVLGGGGAVLTAAMSGRGAPSQPAPTEEQCQAMPEGWCQVVDAARRGSNSTAVPVPWSLLAGIANVSTDFGRTSPYDQIDRYPNRPVPPYLEEHHPELTGNPVLAAAGSSGRSGVGAGGNRAWGGYKNGYIPSSALCALPQAGEQLQCDAARTFIAMNAAFKAKFGQNMKINDSYRDFAGQQAAKIKHGSNAATPGTSDHGWALAADIGELGGAITFSSPTYKWLKANAARYGWDHPSWAEPGGNRPEPWHWEYGNITPVNTAATAANVAFTTAPGSGVFAAGSTCAVEPAEEPIGEGDEQAKGPFLLTPSAAAELEGKGKDPQNPCDAAEFVANKLAMAATDVQGEGDLSLDSATPEKASTFWHAAMQRAGVLADPDSGTVECSVPTSAGDDQAPVGYLIEQIFSCELGKVGDLHTVTSATRSGGKVTFSEMGRESAVPALVAEAKTVSWNFSRWQTQKCSSSAALAGVFPLSIKTATKYGAPDRCDVQANIRAAAKAIAAAESTPVEKRSHKRGPFEPMLGGWRTLDWALGASADAFSQTGPAREWSPGAKCEAKASAFVLAAAQAGSPFGKLAGAQSLPKETGTYTQWLTKAGRPVQQSSECETSDVDAVNAYLSTLAESYVDSVPGFSLGGASSPEPAEGGFDVPNPAASAPARPDFDPAAMAGVATWFNLQASATSPAKARPGTDSVIARLSASTLTVQTPPSEEFTAAVRDVDWQARATDWGIFYGGLVQPWDTFGTVGGSLGAVAGSASGPAGAVSGQVETAVSAAMSQLGIPYSWGGGTPAGPGNGFGSGAGVKGFDCSSLMQFAFAKAGYTLPRVAAAQAAVGEKVPSMAKAKRGDLLFFRSPVTHVALYLGDGKLIHAPKPGDVVKISDVYETPTSIKRVFKDAPATVGGKAPAGWAGKLPAGGAQYASLFESAGAKYGLDPRLLAALAWQESGFRADVIGCRTASSAGARGIVQMMPGTAAGLKVNACDPASAVPGAAKMLKGDYQRFNSLPLALAAYNAGAGNVMKYNGVPPFPETRNYVSSDPKVGVIGKCRALGGCGGS